MMKCRRSTDQIWFSVSQFVNPQGEEMRVPKSMKALEELGRVRLSKSFFMRDFLYSEY